MSHWEDKYPDIPAMAEVSRVLYCTYVHHWLASLHVRQNVQMLCSPPVVTPRSVGGVLLKYFALKIISRFN